MAKKLRNNLPKGTPGRLLVIDDLADRAHEADILLDQNFFGEGSEQRYQKLVPNHCRELFGPHYALLGPEYSQLHPLVPPRKNVRRILVYFGGVDKDNLTGRTLEALMDPAMAHLAALMWFLAASRHTIAQSPNWWNRGLSQHCILHYPVLRD